MPDFFPVPRWQMRFARVVAGSLFPLFLLGSLFLVVSILRSRGWLALGLDLVVASPSLYGWGAVITTLSLLTAYTLSNLLALRFGKVLLGWGIAFLASYLTTIVGVLWGPEGLTARWLEWVGQSPTSPFWAITRAFIPAEPGDLPWVTGWFLAAAGWVYWLSGRHDRS